MGNVSFPSGCFQDFFFVSSFLTFICGVFLVWVFSGLFCLGFSQLLESLWRFMSFAKFGN